MARRSARISSRNSSTPQPVKRVSLAHDERGPRTLPTKLAALKEIDDLPGSFPQSPTEILADTPSKKVKVSTPDRSKITLPSNEMHPQAHHRTTEEKHADARWLGFSNLETKAEAAPEKSSIPRLQMTPSKATGPIAAAATPVFSFTFQREQSLELSPAAKKMMEEKRGEANRLKEQMKSDSPQVTIHQRRIATPKSQRGRYSDAHKQQFQKMDSIAGHASAYRKDPNRLATEHRAPSTLPSPTKSLKRSPSKADLDATPSKMGAGSGPARALGGGTPARDADTSPRKRARHDSESEGTPRRSVHKSVTQHTPSRLPQFATPSKSSFVRTAGSNSIKTVGTSATPGQAGASMPCSSLLTKSPARASIFSPPKVPTSDSKMLARTPLKPNALRSPTSAAAEHRLPAEQCSPLLARSAVKLGLSKMSTEIAGSHGQSGTQLLTQTPTRVGISKEAILGHATDMRATSSAAANLAGRFSLLRATPIKSILRTPQRLYSDDPAKVAAGTHLATPPQLSHLKNRMRAPATAPVQKHVDFSSSTKAREATKKASIGSLFGAEQSNTGKVVSAPLAPITYPSLENEMPVEAKSTPRRRQSGGKHDFTFRAGNQIVFAPSTSPPKSRTASRSPSAFTIRAVVEEALDANPEPAAATGSKKRKMEFENALSVVESAPSPTVTLGSKKRKFDFENEKAEQEAEDKENIPADVANGDQQPAKRLKTSQSPAVLKAQPQAKSVTVDGKKRTTLGVKPKSQVGKPSAKADKKKTGTTISQARLAALAMPKKR